MILRLSCWKSKVEGAGSAEKVTENDRLVECTSTLLGSILPVR